MWRSRGIAGLLFCMLSVATAANQKITQVQERWCESDSDCNLNGKCVPPGVCNCLAAWRGATCGELNLAPAIKGAGLHAGSSSTMSSWGGAVVYDKSAGRSSIRSSSGASGGRWMMYANEMVGSCGINAWESNSRVVRATSPSLDVPFVVDKVVKPAFGSEPSLAQTPGGKWLLYSIGNTSSSHKPRPDCKGGYTPKATAPNGTGGNFRGYVPVEIAEADSVGGPWTLKETIGNGDFNPSPLVLSNGTTLMMWRHLARVHLVGPAPTYAGPFLFNGSDSACPPPPPPLTDHSQPDPAAFTATGRRAEGSSGGAGGEAQAGRPGCSGWHLFPTAVDSRGVEDPFIWVQPTAAAGTVADVADVTFHALYHDHKSFGGHAFSSDAITWTYSSVAPYGAVVNFTDGTNITMYVL